MRIKDVMSHPVVTCRVDMKLDAVVRLMTEFDCGIVPVVDNDGKLTGILTDRDICLAVLDRKQTLEAIAVGDVMAKQVFSCRQDDAVESAERLMRDQQIHRVPVIDKDRRPVGLLSVDDLARMAEKTKTTAADRDFIHTFAEITRPVPARVADGKVAVH